MARMEEFSVGKDASVPLAAQGAAQYASDSGFARPKSFNNVIANPNQGRRIAQEYEAAPMYDKGAEEHYRAMAHETSQQFDFLTKPKHKGGLGVNVEVSQTDPYKKARDMMADASTGNFKVLSTKVTGGHPFFTDDENDKFRAVHDFFGHAATGRGFDPHGEEAAYRSHVAMFSAKARPAMTTETRGQNSALNFGSNPGEFAPQKIATLPSAQLITPIGRRSSFVASVAAAKLAHERAFGK